MFVSILRDIYKEETVEYVLALIDEMLTGKRNDYGLLDRICILDNLPLFISFVSQSKESQIIP